MTTSTPVRALRAVNTDTDSPNRMHADDVAQRYGFRGGLVPGVTVFAYLASAAVSVRGAGWLDDGEAALRLTAPAYDGDDLRIVSDAGSDDDKLVVLRGEERLATCALRADVDGCVGIEEDERLELPPHPPYAPTVEALAPRPPFQTWRRHVTAADALAYAQRVGETEPTLASGARMHPGWILGLANYVLMVNVGLGPWIHTASEVRLCGPAPVDAEWVVGATVLGAGERKGHVVCDLDVSVTADGAPAARVRHHAIVRPREQPAARSGPAS